MSKRVECETHDELERFETLGELYYRRFHRLRPGKSEPLVMHRSANDEENQTQFKNWMESHAALYDAIDRIIELSIDRDYSEYEGEEE